MAFVRSELRAFPRLSCGRPARLELAGMVEDCQVIDLSQGGCKVMPMSLDRVGHLDLHPGQPVKVSVGGLDLDATLAWATPNVSALGCAFVALLDGAVLEALTALPLAAE
jgi:hypothetical protein